jgi:hypothetical protein
MPSGLSLTTPQETKTKKDESETCEVCSMKMSLTPDPLLHLHGMVLQPHPNVIEKCETLLIS